MRKKSIVLFIALTVVTLGTVSAQPDQALPKQDQKAPQAQEPSDPQPAPVPEPAQADAESCSQPQTLAVELTPSPIFQAGQSCGGAICGRGEYCCNPSCSICVPLGWSCTQQSCN